MSARAARSSSSSPSESTEHADFGITFWVLSEYTEGIAEWCKALNLPATAGAGYGAVVWIEEGKMRALVPYAAEAGVESLVNQTLQIWAAPIKLLTGPTSPSTRTAPR